MVKAELQKRCAFSTTETFLGVLWDSTTAGITVLCSYRVDPFSRWQDQTRQSTHCVSTVSETVGTHGSYVQRDSFWPTVNETITVVAQNQGVLPDGATHSTPSGLHADALVP